jgi:hypothetical protein
MDKQHDISRKTMDDASTGKGASRDPVSGARKHSGQFARQHHDAGDTVDAAVQGIEDQGAKNATTLGAQHAEMDRRARRDGESAAGRINRLGDDEYRRRAAAGLPRETEADRHAREIREAQQA